MLRMNKWISVFFIFLSVISCSGKQFKYYNIDKVRVVALLFADSNIISGTTFDTSSQTFPVRPGCTTTNLYAVVLSPNNETPNLSIDSMNMLAIGNYYLSNGGGTRGLPDGTAGTAQTITNYLNTTAITSSSFTFSTFKVTVFSIPVQCGNLTTANLTSQVNQLSDIPAFQIEYSVNTGVSSDKGFYTFYYLPNENDAWWSSVTGVRSQIKLQSIRFGVAVKNNPVQLSHITPVANSTVQSNKAFDISADVNEGAIPSSRSGNPLFVPLARVQWYVNKGLLDLDRSNKTQWNPNASANESVGALIVVRDLLGGIDLKLVGPFTTQ